MKLLRSLSIMLLATLLLGVPTSFLPVSYVIAAQPQAEKKEVRVWVNTKSGVYHCPGSRWYGATKQGKYMPECEARREGYRPAYGDPCGSDCGSKTNEPASPPNNSPPAGATAQCRDGTYSFSQHRRGTCSHHGGVARWL